MSFKKTMSVLLGIVMLTVLLQVAAFGAPSAVELADSSAENAYGDALIFSDNCVEIDIGARQSETNFRYVEIDGVQTKIVENNNKCVVDIGSTNMLVEVTEKASEEAASVVKTQYFFIDVAAKTYKKLDMDTYMQSYEEKAIRTVGEKGIRFKAHALTDAKLEETQYIIDEYGYIVATQEALGTQELTLNFSKYVRGVGFNREENINIVFDSTNDDYDVFTLVLKNIPVANYKTDLVCKTYTKLRVQGRHFVVYGEPIIGSAFEIAADYFALDQSNLEISKMIFDYVAYEGVNKESFADGYVVSNTSNGTVSVTGAFSNTDAVGEKYNVYLLTYSQFGALVGVKKSSDFTVVSGSNSFNASFEISDDEMQTVAVVLTSDLVSVCEEKVIQWQPTHKAFYETISSDAFSSSTDFSEYFNPDSEISYIESIALMSGIHAKYNNTEVKERENYDYNYSLEMDDNDDAINFNHATGEIDEENSYLVGTSVMKDGGGYDPQIIINGLELDSRKINTITIRMKLENVEGTSVNFAGDVCQIFFKTTFAGSFSEAKCFRYSLGKVSNLNDWFEIEIDVGNSSFWNIKSPTATYPDITGDLWKDVITGIRIDPVNSSAKFYIDYVKFSHNSDSEFNTEWYDVYLDYAIDNGFAKLGEVAFEEFTTKTTSKSEFFLMLINAFGEEAFPTINQINAIPDIGKNDEYADLYLLLYRSGITLGFDKDGNLSPESVLTRSQAVSMANKLCVPNNRLMGTVDASWTGDDYEHDIEFDSTSDIDKFSNKTRMSNIVVSDGHLSFSAQYDSYMVRDSLSIDASKYHKLRVRLKAKFEGDAATANRYVEFFFKPEDYNGTLTDYHMSKNITDFYIDTMGWYVFDIDLSTHSEWKGMVNYFRFDTMNSSGDYVIDYIRFIKDPYSDLPTQQDLINAGYTSKKLMPDGFENGFYVSKVDQTVSWADMVAQNRAFTYPGSTGNPVWTIGPWWQGANASEHYDLYENRDTTTDVYTLADKKGINKIVYNPTEKSITQTLNCSLIYNGKPHVEDDYKWWPHQLLDTNANFVNTVTQESHSADADRMFIELDIRLLNFEDKDTANVSTTEHPYRKVCDYLAYFYLRPKKDPGQRIWFGLCLFSGRSLAAPTNITPGWAPDSAAHMYMYGMRQATVYGGIENSLNPSNGEVVLNEWKHIRLDVTPHVDRAIEWANRDNIFGFEVTREDMFWNGVNIGFESAGNYDCTIEIKNFNLVAYYAPEENN